MNNYVSFLERPIDKYIDYFNDNNALEDFLNPIDNLVNSKDYVISNNDNSYTIEILVTGYNKANIEIESKENTLKVSSKFKTDKEKQAFLNISKFNKVFQNSFSIPDNVKIKEAILKNGVLSIILMKIIPEDKKAKLININ